MCFGVRITGVDDAVQLIPSRAQDKKTFQAVLPANKAAEEVEVDEDLNFLSGYVQEALNAGARPYSPPDSGGSGSTHDVYGKGDIFGRRPPLNSGSYRWSPHVFVCVQPTVALPPSLLWRRGSKQRLTQHQQE